MEGVLENSPHGVKEYGSYFAFDNFGESNVDFWLFLQAKDRLASFELRSEIINELHRRYAEEGIVIEYPVRSLRFPGEPDPGADGSAQRIPPAIIRHRPLPTDTPGIDAPGPDGPDAPG